MKDKQLSLVFFLAIGFAVSAIVILFYIFKPSIAVWVDNKIYDTYIRSAEHSSLTDSTLIVDIDDESIRKLGQWPWSRYVLGEILAKLTNAGAVSIGIDILLSESDRSSPKLIKENLMNTFGIGISFKDLPDQLYDNDIFFADILSQTPSILGMYMGFGETESQNGIPEQLKIAILGTPEAKSIYISLLNANSITAALPIFQKVAPSAFINAINDSDGIMRKVPLVIALKTEDGMSIYPNLALQSLANAYGVSTVIAKTDSGGLVSLRVGEVTVPVEEDGSFYIRFKGGSNTYKYISAADIFFGNFDEKDIAGKIIFLGSSAPGLLDIRSTPYDSFYPGVEVHSSVVDNILSENFISIPVWTPGLQVLLIFVLGMFIALLFSRVSAYFALPVSIILLIGVWYSGVYCFNNGYFISPLYICIVIIIESAVILSAQFVFESRQKRKIKSAFARYVSPIVVSQIADMGIDVFKGSEREVTAMFTDIRGFTSISEKLSPEQVVEMLNRYFTPMTALIKNSGGTLDKFIGDAIVAFWNAPLDVADHPKRAIEVGLAMQTELAKLNIGMEKDYGINIRMGAGINTGNVYVGNMGSTELLDYTIIGDNVNLASRLEGLCSKYGVTFVVSEYSIANCKNDFYFLPIDRIKVKGKTQPISVYFPIMIEESEKRKRELEQYEAAFDLYTQGNFCGAQSIFIELVETYVESDVIKLYSIYSERCSDLAKTPPENWDGVWEYTSK